MGFDSNYIFVIDTLQYAGNFEREMCAYCNGHIGDCGVGEEYAEMFKKEVGDPDDYFDNIDLTSDDGCMRPVMIYPTPGTKKQEYNSVALLFDKKPTKKQIKILKERAIKFTQLPTSKEYRNEPVEVIGFRLFSQKRIVTEEQL